MSGDDVRTTTRSSHVLVTLVGLAVVLSAVATQVPAFHAQPRIAPDSITYIEANPLRTPGYPLVLRALQSLPGGLDLLVPFQLLLLASTCVTLAYQFFRTYGRVVLAIALEAAVLGNPLLVSYCFTVLPEAVFASVLMIHLSLVLALSNRWSRVAAAGAGASAAALALIKPSGYAAVAGLAVLAVVRLTPWRRLYWPVVPAALLIFATSAANLLARGFFGTQLQGGYARVAYVTTLLDPETPSPYPRLTNQLGSTTRPIGRSLRSLPTLETFYFIASNEYHGVEETAHREILAEIGRERGKVVTETAAAPMDLKLADATDRIGGALANAAIRQHPGEYAFQVAANAYGLWWLPLVQSAGRASALQSRIDTLIAERPPLQPLPRGFRILPWPAYLVVRVLLAAIFACSVIGVFWVRSPVAGRRFVGYVALLLHGYILLVSLAQPGLPRYALAVWPASALLLMSTVGALTRP